jgi:hypothetical protein
MKKRLCGSLRLIRHFHNVLASIADHVFLVAAQPWSFQLGRGTLPAAFPWSFQLRGGLSAATARRGGTGPEEATAGEREGSLSVRAVLQADTPL